jgi:hypothetical protein
VADGGPRRDPARAFVVLRGREDVDPHVAPQADARRDHGVLADHGDPGREPVRLEHVHDLPVVADPDHRTRTDHDALVDDRGVHDGARTDLHIEQDHRVPDDRALEDLDAR